MISWTFEQKVDAAVRAPLHPGLPRARTTKLIARPDWHQLHTPDAPGSGLNEIAFSQIGEADVERAIDEAIATYHATGHAVKWCVGPWTRPADMNMRLERRGFTSWDVRGMGCATDRGPAAELPLVPEIEVVEVDGANLDAWLATMLSGWSVRGADALYRDAFTTALAARPRHVHLFGALLGGKIVGTAALVVEDGFGYLTGGQVLEEARGRKAYRALISARLMFLRERGHGYAVTHAREATSAPILERLGMETLFRSKCWLLEPPQR